ncbi:hypothetical protein ACS0TY_027436 [Phlomoides rotata]
METRTPVVEGFEDLVVNDLTIPGTRLWDVTLIRAVFINEDVERILKTPISPIGFLDWFVWHFERNGVYSVKSGYELAEGLVLDESQVRNEGWDCLWNLNVPLKVKACLWRICKGFTPSKAELFLRHLLDDKVCSYCKVDIETAWHVFMNCPFARRCWSYTAVEVELERLALEADSVPDFFLQVLGQLSIEKREEFAMVVWRIWKERNSRVWGAISTDKQTAVRLAKRYLHEWQEIRQTKVTKQSAHRPACSVWHYPPNGTLKLNVDAVFFVDSLEMEIGLTLWDSNGTHVYRRSLVLPGLYASEKGEAIGLFEALTWVKELDLRNVLIEMDAKLVVDAFNAPSTNVISVFGDIIEACKMKFNTHPHCSVGWVVREANFVTHRLARSARDSRSPLLGLSFRLMWIASLTRLVRVNT